MQSNTALVVCCVLGLAPVVSLAACGDKGSASASGSANATPEPSVKSSASAAPADESVEIVKHPTAVGDKGTSTKTSSLEMKGEIKKRPVDLAQAATVERTEECTEVKGDVCTKVKVTFASDKASMTEGGKTREMPRPNAGKTYLVTLDDKTVAIELDGGGKPSGAEVELLKQYYKDLLRGQKVMAMLPDGPLKVGDSVDEFAKGLGELAAGDDVDKPTITATGKVKAFRNEGGKKIVVLDLKIGIVGESAKIGHVKFDLDGTLEVRADIGRATATTIAGKHEIAYPHDNGRTTGTMTEKTTATYAY